MGIRSDRKRRRAVPADTLFSRTQQRVLGLLFGQADRSFYGSELIGLAGGGSGAVQRELARLEHAGLVQVRRIGMRKHYQANPHAPLFADLCAIVRKILQPPYPGDSPAALQVAEAQGARYAADPRLARALQRLGVSAADIEKFCRAHGIRKLSFFGSVTRDDFRSDSDADVRVEFDPGRVPGWEIVDLKDELSALFGRPVDLLTNPEIRNPFRRQSIERDLTVAYGA
jgi:predicted nucleotidyltransferase